MFVLGVDEHPALCGMDLDGLCVGDDLLFKDDENPQNIFLSSQVKNLLLILSSILRKMSIYSRSAGVSLSPLTWCR